MIRQHFYPKTYFRHRSLSKGNSKFDSFTYENYEKLSFNQFSVNPIKMNRKSQILKQKNQEKHHVIHSTKTQEQEKYKDKRKYSILNSKNFLQQMNDGNNLNNIILMQIDNRNNRNLQQKVKQNDLQNLFIKSDKKQILKRNINIHRILKHSNTQIQNFSLQNPQKSVKKLVKTSRQAVSTEGPNINFRSSIQKKKKNVISPTQMIINLSILQKKQSINAQRKQLLFEKPTYDLINLNPSKTNKYRQQTKLQYLSKQRKNSIKKNNFQNIQNRNCDLQQKFKGWEIQIQDDVDFTS